MYVYIYIYIASPKHGIIMASRRRPVAFCRIPAVPRCIAPHH